MKLLVVVIMALLVRVQGRDMLDTTNRRKERVRRQLKRVEMSVYLHTLIRDADIPSGFGVVSITCIKRIFEIS